MTQNKLIMSKIDELNTVLQESMHRADIIQRKLKTKLLTVESRQRLETELEEVQDVLRRNKTALEALHKQNSKSFILAASLVFGCFLLYGLYLMLFG